VRSGEKSPALRLSEDGVPEKTDAGAWVARPYILFPNRAARCRCLPHSPLRSRLHSAILGAPIAQISVARILAWPMDQSRFSDALSLAGRATATAVGIAYVAGFLVVAFHLSSYGVVEFNPLRPHILSAGLLFLVVLVVPGYAAFNLFGFLGPVRMSMPGARPIRHVNLFRVQVGTTFYWLSFTMTIGSFGILQDVRFPIDRGLDLVMLLAIPGLAILFLSNFYFDKLWFIFVPAHALVTGGLAASVYKYLAREFFWLTLWYWAAGMAVIVIFHAYKSTDWRGSIQWELAPFWLLALVSLYTAAVYRNVRPWLGGGAPMPAVLYFSTKPPISDSDFLSVKMLDESDSGYYILLEGNTENAYFIRRDLVMAVKYGQVQGGQQQAPAKLTK
jgi:hypothetical protein